VEGAALLQELSRKTRQLSGSPSVNTTDAPDRQRQQAKCSIADNPNCDRMRDKFLEIQTGIVDKADDMKEQLETLRASCKTGRESYKLQITNFENRLGSEQATLTLATKLMNKADEQSRMKGIQLVKQNKEYIKTMRLCTENVKGFESEVCGSIKIRNELSHMSNQNVFTQDCGVSDWTPSDCSATCGGGTQTLVRSVTVLPNGDGMACPPLQMERMCSDKRCPVDCELAMWSGWSSCTAECGGGVTERVRAVEVQEAYGGKSCGETTATDQCNIQSCDNDCSLGSWTTWSPCSKMCDGGFQERRKNVAEDVTGQGACPLVDSEERLEYFECNTQRCVPQLSAGLTTLECVAKFDVVLLLDGSGSLGTKGWDAVKAAGSMLAKAFHGNGEDGSKVAALLFGGPTSWDSYVRCTTYPLPSGESPPDMSADCGLTWVSHFDGDTGGVATKIEGLTWPKATTFTSGALALANVELSSGRPGAQKVVIVITDGKPMSRRKTGEAAMEIRKKVDRLMWVPVTSFAPIEEVKKWATQPAHENVIVVDDFETLKEPDTVSDILATACSKVK